MQIYPWEALGKSDMLPKDKGIDLSLKLLERLRQKDYRLKVLLSLNSRPLTMATITSLIIYRRHSQDWAKIKTLS